MKRTAISLILALTCFSTLAQINITELTVIDGRYCKKGDTTAYSGDVFETNLKGQLTGTGTFADGVLNGLRIKYFDNGNKEIERYYKDGIMHGPSKEYYQNGILKQEVTTVNGQNEGTAIMYYDTGEKCVEWTFEKGIQQGDYFEYARDGRILRQFWFIDGRADYSPDFMRLSNEGVELSRQFKNAEAIEKYDQAIRLNPTVAQTYFNRGAAKSNSFDYLGAIADYNKAIELNPNYMEAYTNRANAKINLYTTKGILSPSPEQLDGACEDLDKALQLGANKYLIEDMKCGHCDKARKKNKKTRP